MTPEAFNAAKRKLAVLRAEADLKRGRKLTPAEKLRNLEEGLGMVPGTIPRMFSNASRACAIAEEPCSEGVNTNTLAHRSKPSGENK